MMYSLCAPLRRPSVHICPLLLATFPHSCPPPLAPPSQLTVAALFRVQYATNSETELIHKLRDANAWYDTLGSELERLEKLRNSVSDRMTVQRRAQEAYAEVLIMLEEHKKLHLSNRSKAQLHEKEQ